VLYFIFLVNKEISNGLAVVEGEEWYTVKSKFFNLTGPPVSSHSSFNSHVGSGGFIINVDSGSVGLGNGLIGVGGVSCVTINVLAESWDNA
jgi:hypothetical protein